MEKKVGEYSFIGGVVLAVVLGVFSLGPATTPWLASILVVLGLAVGFLNVTGKKTKDFLLVSVVLIVAAGFGGAGETFGGIEIIGPYIQGIFTQVLAFVVPATVVVCLKEVEQLART